MSGKRGTRQMTAVYCRAYLVTLGMLLAGGPAFVALAASDISGAGLGLALLICAMGVLLLGIGVAGPSRQMEAWADAASGHEVALVLMALAYPVYLLMAPFYARP
ncbi:hypothetical protein XAP3CFBP6996_016465 [Xanthomonas citri pv. fuscans CFBP 6996]|uniref:hypothetical protein n=1 Tax=Xanthomonas citri TaxID=346 RepID=UPI000C188503|nr:hypothetical protein [Xanthomonas citri]ATS52440.1 hypothetical protein XcfCFBP6992P_17475 [Xanthomonas citri pv. phaseoli var. fuscans]ATS54321.1 hypothetical protein XcfCFBP6994P_03360 [Xanthomonas citri pv. phaseoli var. fuscans]ATS57939.1 hypothetical protein XcfCFBP6996P_00220 [Xanthomonas citri pv. phaseoli var. fuscans]PTY29335.1 hypothetical protein XAP3CFBP6996_016465 [Xanthomonas citri pv. fuscans CFBP 6996]QWN17036.1 hypothetical protein DGN02_15425 [Xanthomonas citri]